MTAFDLPAYLDRIGLAGVEPTPDGIATLQVAQLRAVPFENVDPFLGKVPSLEVGTLERKLVRGGRGGYCYELNGLLGAALDAAGIPARRVLARVRNGAPRGGPRSHLAWVVVVRGRRLLVDAGFGGPGPLRPLDLDSDLEQDAGNGRYRLIRDARTGERVVQRAAEDGWFSLFGFDETPVSDADVEAANYVSATWPKGPFPNRLVVAVWDGTIRHGLVDRTLASDGPDGRRSTEVADHSGLARVLAETFRLTLDRAAVDAIWARLTPADAKAG